MQAAQAFKERVGKCGGATLVLLDDLNPFHRKVKRCERIGLVGT